MEADKYQYEVCPYGNAIQKEGASSTRWARRSALLASQSRRQLQSVRVRRGVLPRRLSIQRWRRARQMAAPHDLNDGVDLQSLPALQGLGNGTTTDQTGSLSAVPGLKAGEIRRGSWCFLPKPPPQAPPPILSVTGHRRASRSLGRFERFEEDYRWAVFQNGASCWQGPARSIKVRAGNSTKQDHLKLFKINTRTTSRALLWGRSAATLRSWLASWTTSSGISGRPTDGRKLCPRHPALLLPVAVFDPKLSTAVRVAEPSAVKKWLCKEEALCCRSGHLRPFCWRGRHGFLHHFTRSTGPTISAIAVVPATSLTATPLHRRTARAVVRGGGGGVVSLGAEPLCVRRQAQDAQRVHQGAPTSLLLVQTCSSHLFSELLTLLTTR